MSSPFATTNAAKAFHPDVVGLAPQDVIPEALIIATSTKAGAVEGDEPAVRVPFVEIPEGDGGFVPEGTSMRPTRTPPRWSSTPAGSRCWPRFRGSNTRAGSAASMLSDAVRRALILKGQRRLPEPGRSHTAGHHAHRLGC